MYNEANEMDLHHEWAHALVFGQPSHQPSYRYSCGLIALRPNRDGIISGYSGLERVQELYGPMITAAHLPSPGTATQPVGAGYHANAWMRLRHEDFDTLKGVLSDIGLTTQVWAD